MASLSLVRKSVAVATRIGRTRCVPSLARPPTCVPVGCRAASTVVSDDGGIELALHDDGFADVTMNRPHQFNTFNDVLIKRFTAVWDDLATRPGAWCRCVRYQVRIPAQHKQHQRAAQCADTCGGCWVCAGVRGVFIKSTGKVFSAGADLEWMKRTAGYTREQNLEDAVCCDCPARHTPAMCRWLDVLTPAPLCTRSTLATCSPSSAVSQSPPLPSFRVRVAANGPACGRSPHFPRSRRRHCVWWRRWTGINR